ncbi:unnamed protein product [Brachionus calyciflorus]|uniref:Uncharacterized protein n=1 Tax=Brachionus calyciflorus TaxID=104777 RepID=A0A814MU06_9BILA|nr:unnamed protein product [Brachionus calyciflorus]
MFDINQLSDDLNKLSMENKCGQVTMSQKQKPLLCLNNYFYQNYVGTIETIKTGRDRGVKYSTIHRKPKYLIELWIFHKRLIDDIPRTTNYCESWHNAFRNMLKKHPNVYCLIDSLRHENKKIENKLLKARTGLIVSRKRDDVILDERIKESMRDSINRTKSHVAVFLFWLKTGLDQQTMASFFSLENRISISHMRQKVRDALTEDFVPFNLGPSVMGRDDWVKQNSEIAKELYFLGENQLDIIADDKISIKQ